ncbi:hypothetical protein PFISCL1PPCAC_21627, partial [Pristionchus fissidentatus]
ANASIVYVVEELLADLDDPLKIKQTLFTLRPMGIPSQVLIDTDAVMRLKMLPQMYQRLVTPVTDEWIKQLEEVACASENRSPRGRKRRASF